MSANPALAANLYADIAKAKEWLAVNVVSSTLAPRYRELVERRAAFTRRVAKREAGDGVPLEDNRLFEEEIRFDALRVENDAQRVRLNAMPHHIAESGAKSSNVVECCSPVNEESADAPIDIQPPPLARISPPFDQKIPISSRPIVSMNRDTPPPPRPEDEPAMAIAFGGGFEEQSGEDSASEQQEKEEVEVRVSVPRRAKTKSKTQRASKQWNDGASPPSLSPKGKRPHSGSAPSDGTLASFITNAVAGDTKFLDRYLDSNIFMGVNTDHKGRNSERAKKRMSILTTRSKKHDLYLKKMQDKMKDKCYSCLETKPLSFELRNSDTHEIIGYMGRDCARLFQLKCDGAIIYDEIVAAKPVSAKELQTFVEQTTAKLESLIKEFQKEDELRQNLTADERADIANGTDLNSDDETQSDEVEDDADNPSDVNFIADNGSSDDSQESYDPKAKVSKKADESEPVSGPESSEDSAKETGEEE